MNAHQLLRQLLDEGKSGDDLHGVLKPHLAPGCQFREYSQPCFGASGGNGTQTCGEIYGCDDSNNNNTYCGPCVVP